MYVCIQILVYQNMQMYIFFRFLIFVVFMNTLAHNTMWERLHLSLPYPRVCIWYRLWTLKYKNDWLSYQFWRWETDNSSVIVIIWKMNYHASLLPLTEKHHEFSDSCAMNKICTLHYTTFIVNYIHLTVSLDKSSPTKLSIHVKTSTLHGVGLKCNWSYTYLTVR